MYLILDSLKIANNKDYNLNVVKEIYVRKSFFSLNKNVRGCQEEESYDQCTTNNYLEALKDKCKCYPLHLRINEKVTKFCFN